MENEFRELYQDIIMDHNRSPRNFHKMKEATHVLDGQNPLCGDHYTLYLKVNDDQIIEDISFYGSGCAISKASASVMSAMLKGQSIEKADQFFKLFQKIVKGEVDPAEYLDKIGKLAAFSGVSEFPIRVKCATLPWHTMHKAVHGSNEKVSTE
ncbi:MAG: SUF system NifU family Fe-S cluster assembly protein [Caldithrix sp.]|nr:SUF system NifU family Fe-S cluster assembly protein [Caldithrix sp.]